MIDIANVVGAYSGKAHMCCCGCSGKHYYPEAQKNNGRSLRGYEILADEISDYNVKRIVNIINKNPDKVQHSAYDDEFLAAVIGRRQYIAYFKK
jgi:hypothetical protein